MVGRDGNLFLGSGKGRLPNVRIVVSVGISTRLLMKLKLS